ncbi:hypothetical protein A1351_14005 [Methylosinus sp. R-45379]|uniref:HK97-gp10 family putative phage morphogenesis protein n=1 Tax=Methylosinus sp. R-45379 TaxID=980563 RepID=UPI0007C8B1DD|nr:HK97-gp10 family putative phage morphogenesis protein [Methylosinus sp. R-45379]OAI26952.1 hypothetical protein A1351_14005 [Methylosinus sp. R-45379]
MSAQLDRLKARLEAIPKEVREAVRPALERSGEELASRMKALAPEDSGALKESIQATPPGGTVPPRSIGAGDEKTAGELQTIVTAGDAKAFYARWVEFGTEKTPAHPFFFPAYRLTRERIKRRLARAIGKAVRENWNKQ